MLERGRVSATRGPPPAQLSGGQRSASPSPRAS
jgi:hypothetical protein